MAENIVDSTFKLLKSDQTFRSNVNLYEFYDLLDTRLESHVVSKICRGCGKDNRSIDCISCNLQTILKDLDYMRPMFENKGLYDSKYYDYFMYWIYGKVTDSNKDGLGTYLFFSNLKDLLEKDIAKNKHKEKYLRIYDRRVLKKKKDLFDFLEYYYFLKSKLTANINKEEYCKYIEYIFELYKAVDQDHIAKAHKWYEEELELFKNKFALEGTNELNLLDIQCPNKCLKNIFDTSKTLCPLEKKDTELCMNEETEALVVAPQRTLQYDHILKEFSAYKKYEEFNKVNGGDNNKYCNDMCDLEKKYTGIKDLCKKLAKNIENLFKKNQNERIDGCEHLYYWIYDHIWDMFSKNSNYISDKESKEKKYLHDYFKNFDDIQGKIISDEYKCDEYHTYLYDINDLYEIYIKECCYCLKSGYCEENCGNYFLCNEKYNPYNLYLKLKCKYLSSGKDFKKVEKPLGVDHYVITASQKSAEGTCTKLACDPFYFTPFGSWLNRKVHKKKKIKDYLPEEHDQELLVHDLEPTYINSRNRKLRLLYHSA
ncbi:PIR Superfamily Protein [Plasmodium ovale curtisi]|uniref:PIR Superfamily Protein n=1 Tax=Plasmodium ovale curtisi TaxID=864141 RepID=A0A1A8WEV9_PLAOA|nr:PIR Superfamily Protein [Plasmodium ovale curtisi]